MMRDLKTRFAILLLIICTGVQVLAQTPTRLGPASDEEIKKALVVVEADQNSLKAHRNYIFAMGMNNPLLWDQYEAWMKKYPTNVNIPLAIGTVYHRAAMPQPKDFLLKAAAMDPKNAQVWYMLGADADLRAQSDLFTAYFEKASLLEPANAGYAYGYLKSLETNDPNTYEKKVFDFVKRFPDDERGAQAVYGLAQRAGNLEDRIHYFEVLRELYSPEKFKSSVSGMVELADAYLQTDPEKALALVNELGWEGDWKIRKQVAESLIKIHQLEADQNYIDAIINLDQVKLPRLNYMNDFLALKKASLQGKTGDVSSAYDSLSVKFAKIPTDPLYNALESYGKKIGKDKEQVDKDIEMIRNSTAVPAHPFELSLYTSNEKLSLNALKGKVILLTFWFPACAPCREEFPHFQTVVDSFQGDSLVYIGINVLPSQDGYVLPFMKNTKYSFIPLRGNMAFEEQNFGVSGGPHNFVIDKNGKIIFKDFRIDNSNHRTLELMLSSLLEKGSVKE
jgi:thiol-disulfide isomerase/thioredoxin